MAPSWLEVLDSTTQACAVHRREDLAGQLRERRSRLLDPKLRVVVVGETGQGKSQLINALLNAPVCAVGDDHTTAVPAIIEHAEAPTAKVITHGPRAIEGPSSQPMPVEAVTAQANREPNVV